MLLAGLARIPAAASAIPLAEMEMPPVTGTETATVQLSGTHTHG